MKWVAIDQLRGSLFWHAHSNGYPPEQLKRSGTPMLKQVSNTWQRSDDDIRKMSARELLETIWAAESVYKDKAEDDYQHDHRQFLTREELETVVFLARRRAQMSAKAGLSS
jgi:hypothetical protein